MIVLYNVGVEFLLMGGIVKFLVEVGLFVKEVFDYIGYLEIMVGCVKMFYLKIYGGIFVCCGVDEVVMEENNIVFIDFVVVNFYLFVVIVVNEDCMLEDVIENIDIGGLMMVCVVVKNYKDVIIVVNVFDYFCVLVEMNDNNGLLIYSICFDLVIKVFEYMVEYDGMIVNYFGVCLDSIGCEVDCDY